MTPEAERARRKMLGILSGTWLAQGCYALARLGIADAIGDGALGVEELSRSTGTDQVALLRLLRALAFAGVLRQPEPGRFALTPASALLRRDVPGSVYLNAVMQGDEVFRSFAEIEHTLRTGEPAFAKVYGTGFYDYLDSHPGAAATFYESMGAQGVPAGLESCDLSGVGTLVDVGGGNGVLLGDVLAGYPRMLGILLEMPEAIASARANLRDVADRVTFTPGSFFDVVPTGGDAYVLCRVLHNWADDAAVRILGRIRAAMRPGARLIVLEEFLPSDGTAPVGGAGIVDLLMLVTLEGRDRTAEEYRALVGSAGFQVTDTRRAAAGDITGVLEAIAS